MRQPLANSASRYVAGSALEMGDKGHRKIGIREYEIQQRDGNITEHTKV